MKNQFRIYKLLLGVALIAELVCFAPDIKAQDKKENKMDNRIELKDTGIITFTKPMTSSMVFTNDFNKYVKLTMKDTLEVENTMPISEGAQKFIDWIKTYYDCEMNRLKDENEFLKKELQGAKSN